APETTEILTNGIVEYFGVYEAYMTNYKTPKEGRFYSTSFDLVEIEKILS
ncbi:MAG: hypothetical protein ICV63_14355, partial [Coleofasciculus sp. Co-bin14]|nr:hypothetical protein [Coleofasciculus sp. Co-bin14]